MPEEYTLDIDLNVLNHLGLNLYSNVPAVVAELIANAWDADASRVDVSVKEQNEGKRIIIQDNGCGMNDADLRKKFLTVGYERRSKGSGDQTEGKGRPVMGRKGIGKLSVLSIARKVYVYTKKDDTDPLAIELDVEKIQEAIERKEKYHPPVINVPEDINLGNSGTALILSDLKKRVNALLDANLRQRVARRFSIISKDFQVFVNDDEITINDRNYFGKLEYALVYGNFKKSNFKHYKRYVVQRAENTVDEQGQYSVRGWIGLVKESGTLQDGADNLNKISILSRGKVALEDILDSYREGGLYTKYIIGELEADFLDLTEEDDIATSSRQDFIQSDERFVQLREFVEQELKYLANERVKLKDEEGAKKASEIPAVKEWYESLKGDSKTSAKKLFGRINQIATDEDHRKTLYKHGVLAFEHLHHKEKLNELEQLDIENLEIAVKLFSELDDIEASWYYQITEGRLDVIRKLSDDIDEDVLEKIIQEHIYNHLWLLDPSWDRATETPTLEQSVTTTFEKISDRLSEEEKKGRLDIRYKKTSGKHVIVELKRGSVPVSSDSLSGQVYKYIRALRKQLREANEDGSVEAICLVGKELSDGEDSESRQEIEQSLAAKNIRVITYKQLIRDAEASYQHYLEKSKDIGRIRRLLDEIETFDGSTS